MIERIDTNTGATIANVDDAHTQILKYREYITGVRRPVGEAFPPHYNRRSGYKTALLTYSTSVRR